MRRRAIALLALVAACKGGQAATTTTTQAAPSSSTLAAEGPADAALEAAPAVAPAPHVVESGLCAAIGRPGGSFAQYLARRDLVTSFVSGDDLLALVNRSPMGALPPDYAPADLVALRGGEAVTAHECEQRYGACLRKDAAEALQAMTAALREQGFAARVESAFRSYRGQCGVFYHWATKDPEKSTFCDASEQSALAGHSQHQLGTTVDMFTEDWFREGEKKHEGSFRDGFGCTRAGLWLDENAWRFGFVLPYPIHPDDRTGQHGCLARWDLHVPPNPRTGYRNEPWHLRYIGKEDAARFHDEWAASGPGTPDEITLEQWLRRRAGLPGDADLPVCDGCSCGACATLTKPEEGDAGAVKDPCGDASLWMDPTTGRPWAPAAEPQVLAARARRVKGGFVEIEVKLRSPAHALTQPPVFDGQGPRYADGATYASLVPYGRGAHHYDDLPGAWRIGVAADGASDWPWRASIAKARLARTMNRANLYLPAQPGESAVKLSIAAGAVLARVKVTLLRDGEEHGTRLVEIEN